jgi:hypothetical protein
MKHIFAVVVLLSCLSCTAGAVSSDLDQAAPPNPIAAPSSFTLGQRSNLYLHDTYGPFSIFSSAFTAGIHQAQNDVPEWGQGMAGYGRRFSSSLGKKVIENSIQFGLGYALHEDTRFFASGRSGIWNRTFYAASHTFLSRKDSGETRPAYSYFTGVAGGLYISRQWHPDKDRTPSAYISSAAISVGFDVVRNTFAEFWPELKKIFSR